MNGESIALKDSSNARYKDFVIGGNSVQEETPTPDTPIEIESVDTASVGIVGKNLLNPIGANDNAKGITFTNNKDGSFTINGTSTGTVSFVLTDISKYQIKLFKGKTYTQSVNIVSGTKDGFSIVPAVKDNEGTITWNYFTNNQTKTPDKDYTFHAYTVYINSGVTVDCTFKVQLEEGPIATEWEAFKKQSFEVPLTETLRSLPNGTKDTIEKDGIHRKVGVKVLDGSEAWTPGTSQDLTNTNLFYHSISGQNTSYSTNIVPAMCNYFETQFVWGKDFEGVCIQSNNGALMVRINKDRLTDNTLAEFKTWLSLNPVTVQYELAEEIIEPFTEEQHEAYNNIINNGTYKNITNIYSTNEINPIFKVEYSKDLETIINNLQGGV